MRNDLTKHSRGAFANALLNIAFPDFPCEGQGDRVERTVTFDGCTWECRLLPNSNSNVPRCFLLNPTQAGRGGTILGQVELTADGAFRVNLICY